jgi:hypothetical protein
MQKLIAKRISLFTIHAEDGSITQRRIERQGNEVGAGLNHRFLGNERKHQLGDAWLR